jgi:ketosteroid isomerase-like protein
VVTVKYSLALLAALLLLIIGSIWIIARADFAEDSGIGVEVAAAARSFDAAQLSKDEAELDRFLAPDMRFIRGSGVAVGKREFIAAFTDPSTVFSSFEIRKREIITLGQDAAIVSAEATIRGKSAGQPFEEHIRYSDLFARVDGRLRVVHVQVTPLVQP